jgi:RNA polymerase sigma-70 factor (ECF subfamily)
VSADPSIAVEAALVLAARAGDPAAFGELVRRHQGPVRRLLRHLCGDAASADDLAQEVFVRAWTRLSTLERPSAFPAWMRQVAITIFLQGRRRASLETSSLDDLDDAAHPARADASGLDLQRALASLSPGERLCVTLHHAEGMSHPEIAAASGLPLGTVKSHIARGTRRMRAFLEVSP